MLKLVPVVISFIATSAYAGANQCSFNQGNCPYTTNGGHGLVQDYGYGGFGATVGKAAKSALKTLVNPLNPIIELARGPVNTECLYNPATPIYTGAATLYNGDADDPVRAELVAFQCASPANFGFSFTSGITDILKVGQQIDAPLEEIAFLTALKDISDFNECQQGLYRALDNPGTRTDLLNNAYNQFRDIASDPVLISAMRNERVARDRLAEGSYKQNCIKESCQQMTVRDVELVRTRNTDRQTSTDSRARIDSILSRIPLANRDSMRTAIEGLIQSGDTSEASFRRTYDAQIRGMDQELQRSRKQIQDITVSAPGDSQVQYCIDRNLKENIFRSGQLDHTVHRLGLDDALSQFKIRSANRYGLAGTIITELALIPTYFVGYGAARLALRAGASSVKAIATGGRVLSGVTRIATLGLEAADYGTAISGALADCGSNDFYAKVDGKACNPLDEVGNLYEESSLAQCLTSTILPFATPLVGSAVRVVSSRRLDNLYSAARPGEEIIVNAVSAESFANRFLTPDEAGRALDNLKLERNNIDLYGDNPILPASVVKGLSSNQRIVIVQEISGARLNPTDARAILNLTSAKSRSRGAAALENDLKQILIRSGVDSEEAADFSRKIVASNALGTVPRPGAVSNGGIVIDEAPTPRRATSTPDAPAVANRVDNLAPTTVAARADVVPDAPTNVIDNFQGPTPGRYTDFPPSTKRDLERAGIDGETLLNPRKKVPNPEAEKQITRFELDRRFAQWREAGVSNEIFDFLNGLNAAEKKRYLAILLNTPPANLRQTLLRLENFKKLTNVEAKNAFIGANRLNIDRLGDEITSLLPETAATRDAIARLTRERSALLQQTTLLELGDNVEITSLFSSRATKEDFLNQKKIPHSLDDTFSVDIRVTRDGGLDVCRGGFLGAKTFSGVAGGFTTFCRGSNLQERNPLGQFVAAPDDAARVGTVDSGYNDFYRYSLRENDEISLGLNGPVKYTDDSQAGSGGVGGGIEFFAYRVENNPVNLDRLVARTRIPTCGKGVCPEIYQINANLTQQNLARQANVSEYLKGQRVFADKFFNQNAAKIDQFASRIPVDDQAALKLLRTEFGDVRYAALARREIDLRDPASILGRQGNTDLNRIISTTREAEAIGPNVVAAVKRSSNPAQAQAEVTRILNDTDLVKSYRNLEREIAVDLDLLRRGTLAPQRRQEVFRNLSVKSGQLQDLELPLNSLRYSAGSALRNPDNLVPGGADLSKYVNSIMSQQSGFVRAPAIAP